jgi:hypothetical protein
VPTFTVTATTASGGAAAISWDETDSTALCHSDDAIAANATAVEASAPTFSVSLGGGDLNRRIVRRTVTIQQQGSAASTSLPRKAVAAAAASDVASRIASDRFQPESAADTEAGGRGSRGTRQSGDDGRPQRFRDDRRQRRRDQSPSRSRSRSRSPSNSTRGR